MARNKKFKEDDTHLTVRVINANVLKLPSPFDDEL